MNTNLNIEDFGVLLADGTRDNLGDDYSVMYREIIKNNGVVYHAIVVKKKDDNIAPTIYIDELFREYLRGRKIKALAENVVSVYFNSISREEFKVKFYSDFAKVCEHLSFKLVSYDRNKKILMDVPYRQVEDLALVPICCVDSIHLGKGNITVTRRHLEMWEISEEELWENIFENADKVMPVKIVGVDEYISSQTGVSFGEYLDNVYVVTNKEMRHGASAVLFPGVLKGLADKHSSDLLVIPSSAHETIVMPLYMAGEGRCPITYVIKEVNEAVVSDEDVLSDNAYIYFREEDRLEIYKEKSA